MRLPLMLSLLFALAGCSSTPPADTTAATPTTPSAAECTAAGTLRVPFLYSVVGFRAITTMYKTVV